MKHYRWTGAKLKWIADNGLQAVAVGSAMAHNLLLWAGLPPSETLGKCGKCKIVQLLFGCSVPVALYLEGQTETPPRKWQP